MMNYIWAGMMVFSFISAVFFGNMQFLSDGITDAAANAVAIIIELVGILMLWSGVMNIAERSGLTAKMARMLSPALKFLFPDVDPRSETGQAISMNVTANLLGLGSAATPLGIEAMKRLYKDGGKRPYATDNMVRFVVINTASLHLIPTTIAMFRQDYGAKVPMDILPASVLTSACALSAGLLMTAILKRIFKVK